MIEFYEGNFKQEHTPDECDQIIIEANRVVLNKHLEKIANFTLSVVQCETNSKTISKCEDYPDWKVDSSWKDLSDPNMKMDKKYSSNFQIDDENVFSSINTSLCKNTSKTSNSESSFETQGLHRKYFDLWRNSLRSKKGEVKYSLMTHDEKLDNFMENLRKCKKNNGYKFCHKNEFCTTEHSNQVENTPKSLTDTKPHSNYQNRYNAQKNIIDMQKAKLAEQNKIIDELKLGIIQKDLLDSIENTKINIREIFSNCSGKFKCKVPIISIEQPKLNINSHKAPKIVKQMKQRALERAQNHERILQRKRLIEEKRQRLLEEAVEKKRVLEEEEKKRYLEMMKERKRKEIEREKIRQATKQRYLDNVNKATQFHNRILIQQCFKKLYINLQKNREKHNLACYSYNKILLRRSFNCWMSSIECLYRVKYEMADAHYEYKILESSLKTWQEFRLETTRNMQVAEDLYDFRLTSNTFINWHRFVCTQLILQGKNMKKAIKHFERRILFHYFYQWKSLKAVNQLERAKELKKRKWREKVWEILPDYNPTIEF